VANLNIGHKDEIHLRLDKKDVRKSRIHELLTDDLIAVEQTQPFLEAKYVNHTILLTYREADNGNKRFGFEVKIREVDSNNKIVLQKLSNPAPCDLRIWPRIRLDLLPNVRAFCHDKEIQIIDISGGGAHMILHRDEYENPEVGKIVHIKFIFDKGEAVVEGEILRKWKDASQMDHVAIGFFDGNNIGYFIF
jgi:hypothetical protein